MTIDIAVLGVGAVGGYFGDSALILELRLLFMFENGDLINCIVTV